MILPQRIPDHLLFLRSWMMRPLQVAAIAPSSRWLTDAITAEISRDAGPVLELGAGTGVFTQALLRRGVPEEALTLIEREPVFVELLRTRFPAASVLECDAAMQLGHCDWGYCVYRRESASCLGDDRGPNPVIRTQSICATCSNFAVTEKHRPVWEERRKQNARLLAHPMLDDGSRALAQARIGECDSILAELQQGWRSDES